MEFQVGRLPVVTGDPVGLRQLFTNLLENAGRHGGRPDLVVVVDGRQRPDGGVELSVRDNGQGIPAEHRERVFGSSSAWKGPRPATDRGWGWPSAARSSRSWAVPSASGVTAGPTSGSSGGRGGPLAGPGADRGGAPVRTLRVLLVEDDEDHVFLIRRALADLAGVAVAVEVAADGEQALERLGRARFEAGGLPSWSCST